MLKENTNPPHFHAMYQGKKAAFNMDGDLIAGEIPRGQCKLIEAWAEIHKEELLANWELARCQKKLKRIKPLR